jgi:hypothetical protein
MITFIAAHWFIIGFLAYFAVLAYRRHLRRLSKRLDRQYESDYTRKEFYSVMLHSAWQQGYAQGHENAMRKVA